MCAKCPAVFDFLSSVLLPNLRLGSVDLRIPSSRAGAYARVSGQTLRQVLQPIT
jgi:hypothetical protein